MDIQLSDGCAASDMADNGESGKCSRSTPTVSEGLEKIKGGIRLASNNNYMRIVNCKDGYQVVVFMMEVVSPWRANAFSGESRMQSRKFILIRGNKRTKLTNTCTNDTIRIYYG
ncbi:hypothetical protein Acr_29g0003890 [Actinidia rufa]|uniref:Uncharacterized protein n=1 Tax=Actinidia rufa TaxID=165716 RepID=A0A7J0HDL6_9ERIC|nr:hypothetical protein Acr_29g0003890 [Actinidia rufa]